MIAKNRIIAMVCALAICLCSTACNNKSNSGEDGTAQAVVDGGDNTVDYKKQQQYGFPSFLSNLEYADVLSNPSFSSFDSTMITEVKTQPFEDYECVASYSGKLYIYKTGDFQGLLDSTGKVILTADTYARVEICSPDMLRLYHFDTDDSTFDYAQLNADNELTILDGYKFKASAITIVENTDKDTDLITYSIRINDTIVNSTLWDCVTEIDIGSLETKKTCKKAYMVTKDDAYYIVTVDEFYNYVVYEGKYSSVLMNIGASKGSCYILSYEDNEEVQTLINSFGKSQADSDAVPDANADSITFTFGLNLAEQTIISVYSDGLFSVSVKQTEEDMLAQSADMGYQYSFDKAYVDKQAFTDLVRWVDSVVSQEYE